MAFSYKKLPNGKYKVSGLENITDYNQLFLDLYNRFDRAVMAYGYAKNNTRLVVVDFENNLRKEGNVDNAEKISTIRKTRNLLVHGNGPAFTINMDMIKSLIALIINLEEKVEFLKKQK